MARRRRLWGIVFTTQDSHQNDEKRQEPKASAHDRQSSCLKRCASIAQEQLRSGDRVTIPPDHHERYSPQNDCLCVSIRL